MSINRKIRFIRNHKTESISSSVPNWKKKIKIVFFLSSLSVHCKIVYSFGWLDDVFWGWFQFIELNKTITNINGYDTYTDSEFHIGQMCGVHDIFVSVFFFSFIFLLFDFFFPFSSILKISLPQLFINKVEHNEWWKIHFLQFLLVKSRYKIDLIWRRWLLLLHFSLLFLFFFRDSKERINTRCNNHFRSLWTTTTTTKKAFNLRTDAMTKAKICTNKNNNRSSNSNSNNET